MSIKSLAKVSILCLILASCDNRPPGKDQYPFNKAEYVRLKPDISFVVHSSLEDLRKKAPAESKTEGRILMAWSSLMGNTCEVHIVDPQVSYKPEWIGHEITHCIYGRWHS